MTDENFDETRKKLLKYFFNGITHKLILWIISEEPIHGYGIMKKLDKFYNFEDVECELNINSSKIYPILSKMEEKGLITGEWKVNEKNKSVKYYSITDSGIELLDQIKNRMNIILNNPSWLSFFNDMTGLEIDNEKRN